MRWSGQEMGGERQLALPGSEGDVVVRRFQAPEALDTRFYEVRAKSALNRVPGGSRVPFRWTVNPYRGCAHACTYCARPDTPVLMADGRTRAIGELEPGDRIIGTTHGGAYRRYAETVVLDRWSSVKPAFRTTLEDGTEIVTSGDHRFLTRRGWKYVTGNGSGRGRRPHLTTNDVMLGTGAFAVAPSDTFDYRLGYLCGMIRGDGTLASRPYRRASGAQWTHHFFRLALADHEALTRTRGYLADAAVVTGEFTFAAAGPNRRAIQAIRTQSRDSVARIGELIRWPRAPSADWCKGFLAGIFDAEGSSSRGIVRIANAKREMLHRTQEALGGFGFDAVEEIRPQSAVRSIRVRGGLRERLRLMLLIDPAISRKRSITGTALKSGAARRVISIEPVGRTMRLVDISTGTGDFVSNGVVSHNCFARPTHEYLDLDAGRDFEREIIVKVNVPEVLRAELRRPSWGGEHVALGTNTDPYQWVEGRYRLMRGIWAALRDTATPCSVLTKSPLVLRDVDLLKEIGARTQVGACLSVPTLEERAWRATEPRTPHPSARLEAVAELNRQGIPTGVLIAPLMPGINDAPEQVEAILERAAAAGATSVGGQALFLRGATRELFLDWLRTMRPDLVERYEALYADGPHLRRDERLRREGTLRRLQHGHALAPERFFRRLPRAPDPAAPAPPSPRPDAQASLF